MELLKIKLLFHGCFMHYSGSDGRAALPAAGGAAARGWPRSVPHGTARSGVTLPRAVGPP